MALAAQGFADPRPTGRIDRRHVRRVFDRVGLIQIDSVNVLVALPGAAAVRAARSAPARPAAEDARCRRAVRVLGARGVAAADRDAAVVPLDDGREVHPLGRAAARWREEHPDVVERCSTRGDRTRADRAERHRRARRAARGRGGAGTTPSARSRCCSRTGRSRPGAARNFEREYDLLHRMLPAEHVETPGLSEDEAAPGDAPAPRRARSASAPSPTSATTSGSTCPRRAPGDRRARRRGRAAAGAGRGLEAAGVRRPATRACRAGSRPRALLSPFDSLVWFRDRTERLFGFRYRIEIYTPAPQAGVRLLRAAVPARRPARGAAST